MGIDNHSSFFIPEKTYYKTSEVCDLLRVRPHVVRYWESEFSQLQPHTSKSGQRLYRYADVHIFTAIHQLLYTEGLSIEEVKQELDNQAEKSPKTNGPQIATSAESNIEQTHILDACVMVEKGQRSIAAEIPVTCEAVVNTKSNALANEAVMAKLRSTRSAIEQSLKRFGGQFGGLPSIN